MNKYALLLLSFFITSCSGSKYVYDVVQDWQQNYPDNFIEEKIEDFIKDKTGKDIDLTPITGNEKVTFKLPDIYEIKK